MAASMLVALAACSTFFYLKSRDAGREVESLNSRLGEATKNNLELGNKLKESEDNFGTAAVAAIDLNARVKKLGDAIGDYETTSNETMDWFISNCYFYNGDEKTADYMILRHKDKVQAIADDLEDFVSDYSDF